MKEFWIYIEPYVYISIVPHRGLLYNTLNYRYYENTHNDVLNILKKLKDNNYTIKITEDAKKTPELDLLIQWLKISFSGDCISTDIISQKPVQFVPRLFQKSSSDNFIEPIEGRNISQCLWGIYIYLNSDCKSDCHYCNTLYKQILYCKCDHLKQEQLKIEDIEKIYYQAIASSLHELHFLGANILLYNDLKKLISFTQSLNINTHFYLNLRNIKNILDISLFQGSKTNLHLLVCIKDMTNSNIELIKQILLKKEETIVTFIVQDEVDLNFITLNCDFVTNYNIKPFYNDTNIEFFEQYVYLNRKDILSSKFSMMDILRNQKVNTAFFGKLYIDVDGKIYTSFNLKAISDISKNIISDIVPISMQKESSWRLLKSEQYECSSCLYKLLCAPMSDYELYMKNYTLCHLNKLHHSDVQ